MKRFMLTLTTAGAFTFTFTAADEPPIHYQPYCCHGDEGEGVWYGPCTVWSNDFTSFVSVVSYEEAVAYRDRHNEIEHGGEELADIREMRWSDIRCEYPDPVVGPGIEERHLRHAPPIGWGAREFVCRRDRNGTLRGVDKRYITIDERFRREE